MTAGPADPGLGRIVLADLRRRDLQRSLSRDLRDLYRFYLSEERRAELSAMGRLRRSYWVARGLARGLVTNLPPVRRLLLLLGLVLFALGYTSVRMAGTDPQLWGFGLLLLVLMLELKDKLLARDEIEVARQVQLALLPRAHPVIPGWQVWSAMRPANDVGGDLVDYLDLGDGRHGIALGDVAGKGMGAALLAAKLQATLRALAPGSPSLADLGARANRILFRDGLDNRFATLFYFELTAGGSRVRFLNAGHNAAFHVAAGGETPLRACSIPLGMLPEAPGGEGERDLLAGDLLVVYSDGLTEARSPAGEEFGLERLRGLLPGLRGLRPEEAGARILAAVDRFLAAEKPQDDLSVVVVQREV
jgi:phosphoserine phosphatase RsbU/P